MPEDEFVMHVVKESFRQGLPLPRSTPPPDSATDKDKAAYEARQIRIAKAARRFAKALGDETSEALRRYGIACRRAIDDPGHLRHLEAWANGVLARPGRSEDVSCAREIVRRFDAIRETSDLDSVAVRSAVSLGALLMEFHLRFGWKRDALAGRKSRSQGAVGRRFGHLGGREALLRPETVKRLLALSPAQRHRELELAATEEGIKPASMKRRLARARRRAEAGKSRA